MGESSFEIPSVEKPSERRLDSWKEIAAYLNRDVTTVQRWEKREGMPVHRHLHDRVGSVYAFRTELDQWAQSRKLQTEQSNAVSSASATTPADGAPVSSRKSNRRQVFIVSLAALVLLVLGAGFWLHRTEYFWRSPVEWRAISGDHRLRWG